MRLSNIILMVLVCLPAHAQPLKPDNEKTRASYSVGYKLGLELKTISNAVDLDSIRRGITDGISDVPPLLSEEERSQAIKYLSDNLNKVKAKLAAENLSKGQAFLKENAKKSGVMVLESGLQYRVIKVGVGKQPRAKDEVTVNYRGTQIDGTEFDSSYKRNSSATFPLDRVIEGWTEGLQLMNEGSKFEFFIPAELAYGEDGAKPKIGPNETLVFEVELISVNPAKDN